MLNSTAIQVFWRSPVQSRQHGQIRGYQVHYVRMENGEARGLPHIKDIMLADAQVRARLSEPPRGWEGWGPRPPCLIPGSVTLGRAVRTRDEAWLSLCSSFVLPDSVMWKSMNCCPSTEINIHPSFLPPWVWEVF